MFEESVSAIPSMWASLTSWFTPTILFVLINVMIGTIFIASNLVGGAVAKNQDDHQHQRGLARSPSVLQRLKSINLYSYRSPEPHAAIAYENPLEFTEHTHYASRHTHELEQPQFTRSPSLLQRLKSMNFYIPQDYSTPPPHAAVAAAYEQSPEITENTHNASRRTHELEQPQFSRSPSLLQRLKSINFYIPQDYSTPPPSAAVTTAAKTHLPESDFHRDQFQDDDFLEDPDEKSEEEAEEQNLDEVFSQLKPLPDHHHVNRSMSDTKPVAGEVPTKLARKMKKSASSKSAFAHFQEEDIMESRRPATVREKKAAKLAAEDEEVDAKADDFINKFKHQLKLQRLDSIIRYKDMINRGSSDK